jgi:predicted nucleotidyltransferase
MLDPSIMTSLQAYLRAVQASGINAKFVVVFGSWAKGRADAWSDIDVLVVSPRFDRGIARSDVDLLWRLAAQTDSRIEPIPCGERQWTEDDSSAVVEMARREGERVSAGESAQPVDT